MLKCSTFVFLFLLVSNLHAQQWNEPMFNTKVVSPAPVTRHPRVFIVAVPQRNDPMFDTKVASPAHVVNHPRVLIDAAHNNVFSATTNRIDPLAQLLRADGLIVDNGREAFTEQSLSSYNILLVMTAQGKSDPAAPAFTPVEIDAVYQWVNKGGAMLFCVDHYPFGNSGKQLAERFGVHVSLDPVKDPVTSDRWHNDYSTPVYSHSNQGLADHPITRGRNQDERLEKVAVFGGLSLTGPKESSNLLRVSTSAGNTVDTGEGLGTSQALALTVGRGRLVITADCSMWTAQLVTFEGKEFQYGMAREDFDNRQFALNVVRWLSGNIK